MTCRVDVSRLRNILFDTSSFMFFAFPRALDTPSCDSICPALLTMSPSGRRESLLFLNFNQDQGCFACGTDAGFRIYNCDPFKETFRRRFDATNAGGAGGGIGIVEMLFRCNILALVGGGRAPRYSPNKVMLWDDHQSRCIGELSFRVEVRAVKLRRDKIVVVLEHKIYVYNFSDLKIVHQTDTVANPKGLCALSPTQGHTVMACPGLNKGQVRVELYDVGATKFISAHDGDLAMLALSLDGARLATASEKGTLVRVYDTASATLLREFRRGADRATIYSIAFSATNEFLACSSDKGTVHVWEVSDDANETTSPEESDARADSSGTTEKKKPTADEALLGGSSIGSSISAESSAVERTTPSATTPMGVAQSALTFAAGFLPANLGLAGERSVAQFKLPDFTRSLVAFGPEPRTLVVVTAEGTYYKVAFDSKEEGGQCTQREFARFMKSEMQEEEGGWGAAEEADRTTADAS